MDYVFGYGSLLSHYSRTHYSGITASPVPARLKGWSRSWCAAYPDESATYAGAVCDASAELDGILIATQIDQKLAEREREYRFTEVPHEKLALDDNAKALASNDRVFVCETFLPKPPTEQLPLPQSYIDTCLIGCFEFSGADGMARFIDQTTGWDCYWLNDRSSHIYPRSSRISVNDADLIDRVLEQKGVLNNRILVD